MTLTDLPHPFRHECLPYTDEASFIAGTAAFVREGVERGEPVLAFLPGPRVGPLRAALGAAADAMHVIDTIDVGSNPARILPAFQAFIAEHPGRAVRGLGEPIWPGRDAAEIVEAQRHEALLNRAFAGTAGVAILCPHDDHLLPAAVAAEARANHSHIRAGATCTPNPGYSGTEGTRSAFDVELAPVPDGVAAEPFDETRLSRLRHHVAELASRTGMAASRVDDLVLATSELMANSVRHGGGHGVLHGWIDDGVVICEVCDRGRMSDPLAGRRLPVPGQLGGYGLYLAHQLCDLVQIRTTPRGTTVRLRMAAR